MTYEQWVHTYMPIANVNDPDAEYDGTLHSTDDTFVDAQPANTVWTLVTGDHGLYIIEGFHYVNREGYFVTAKPHDGTPMEVKVS